MMQDHHYRGVTIRLLTASGCTRLYSAELINADGERFKSTHWYEHPDYALRNAQTLVDLYRSINRPTDGCIRRAPSTGLGTGPSAGLRTGITNQPR